jgi:hypothetical protein
MDGKCKQPYTIRGTARFATSRSQGSTRDVTFGARLSDAAGHRGARSHTPGLAGGALERLLRTAAGLTRGGDRPRFLLDYGTASSGKASRQTV